MNIPKHLIRPHEGKKRQNVLRVHFLQYGSMRPQGPLESGPYPAPMSILMALCSISPILQTVIIIRKYV